MKGTFHVERGGWGWCLAADIAVIKHCKAIFYNFRVGDDGEMRLVKVEEIDGNAEIYKLSNEKKKYQTVGSDSMILLAKEDFGDRF